MKLEKENSSKKRINFAKKDITNEDKKNRLTNDSYNIDNSYGENYSTANSTFENNKKKKQNVIKENIEFTIKGKTKTNQGMETMEETDKEIIINSQNVDEYIYDILVNFNKNDLFEFYEWNDNDNIINIKKIKLARVDTNTLDNLINGSCKVDESLLVNIYRTCDVYNRNKYDYACLITDSNRVIAFIFDKDGKFTACSNYPECKYIKHTEKKEIKEIALLSKDLEKYNLIYVSDSETTKEKITFFTRQEKEIFKYLSDEIKRIYKSREYSKLKYIYQEYFDDASKSNKDMVNKLLGSLDKIDNKHKEIYSVLVQTKKQV